MLGIPSLMRVAIAASAVAALTTPASLAGAEAGPTDARSLIARMSAEIAGLDRFVLSGDAYTDAWLEDGLLVENSADVTMKVRRPAEMRLTKQDAQTTLEIFFGGGVLTVFDRSRDFYAQKEIPGDVDSALDYAVNEVGIDAPLLDFISRDVSKHLLEDAQEVRYLGTARVRGSLFHLVSIRQPTVDVQIWIATADRPLPGKMTIRSRWDAGAPRFVVFLEWDTSPDLPEEALAFVAPDGATRIEFELEDE